MTDTQTGVRSTRWIWIAAMWVAGALFEAGQSVPFMLKLGPRLAIVASYFSLCAFQRRIFRRKIAPRAAK
jgi:hypothetical protein